MLRPILTGPIAMTNALETAIEAAWEDRASLSPDTRGEARDAIETAIAGLDNGTYRVASKTGNGDWTVHQWLKKAVLLGFRIHPNAMMTGGPQDGHFYDKVPSSSKAGQKKTSRKRPFALSHLRLSAVGHISRLSLIHI